MPDLYHEPYRRHNRQSAAIIPPAEQDRPPARFEQSVSEKPINLTPDTSFLLARRNKSSHIAAEEPQQLIPIQMNDHHSPATYRGVNPHLRNPLPRDLFS